MFTSIYEYFLKLYFLTNNITDIRKAVKLLVDILEFTLLQILCIK